MKFLHFLFLAKLESYVLVRWNFSYMGIIIMQLQSFTSIQQFDC